MTKPTLLVLAAGMGSRYGSLKQMDGVGPGGEAIIDYSIFDAVRAGFGKVIFVIRHSFEKEFREVFSDDRFGGRIETGFVFQELDRLPQGFSVPPGREKPWGTNHAVMMADGVIDTPFAVINADDFYGQNSFEVLGGCLRSAAGGRDNYCMVGYKLKNTLSDFGTVSRGVCSTDREGHLIDIAERHSIARAGDGHIYYQLDGRQFPLGDDTPVSMNMFGFTPDYFDYSREYFQTFLRQEGGNLKSEFYIPTMVNKLIGDGTSRMKVLATDSQWFGVTYKEDRPMVVEKINSLIAAGIYPERLWR